MNWISQPFALIGFATGKISIGLLILRIIGPNTVWRKWILYFFMASVILLDSLQCILTFVQCNPPSALWMPELITSGQAKCWDPNIQERFGLFVSSE